MGFWQWGFYWNRWSNPAKRRLSLRNSHVSGSNWVLQQYVINEISNRRVPAKAKKVLEADLHTWRHVHELLRWPEIRTIIFSFISTRNIHHVSKLWDGQKLAEKWNSRQRLSEFWAILGFSEENNWAILGFWHVINISIRNKREN